jgi:uncharacterized RDD family membrane protein YckC
MRNAARSSISSSLVVSLFLLALMASVTFAGSRDLLAHGDDAGAADSHLWLARVTAVKDAQPPYEQTELRGQAGFGENWAVMPPLSARVVSLASYKGELVAVLSDGSWCIAAGDGARSGPPLPANASMIAAGNEQDLLWAIGIPAHAPASTAPSTKPDISVSLQPEPASQPATAPSMSAVPHRLVAYRFQNGSWTDATPLPAGLPLAPDRLSMTVVKGSPVVAWLGDDRAIHVIRWTSDHVWSDAIDVQPVPNLVDFKLLTIRGKAALWMLGNSAASPASTQPAAFSAGSLCFGDRLSQRIVLQTLGATPPANVPETFTLGLGWLRLLAESDGKTFQQTYDFDAKPLSPMPAVADAKPEKIEIAPWAIGAGIIIVIAAVAAFMQRRNGVEDVPVAEDGQMRLASFGVRLAAGVIDLMPFLVALYVIQPFMSKEGGAMVDKTSLEHLAELATITYVLHTLIAELICGQSLGKMMFNLRVVGPDGKSPRPTAIIVRNILRILDVNLIFPLLLVVFSPKRQRFGDFAAGTVVVSRDEEKEEEGSPRRDKEREEQP